MAVMETILGIVTAVIGFVIVDSVIAAQSWNSSLSTTVSGYIVPIGLTGVLAGAAMLYFGR